MPKVKGPLFSFKATGPLAKAFSFVRRRKQDIVEKIPKPYDAKSPDQLIWRHMYQKAVDLWHGLSSEEKQEWESLARRKHMSGFAWFISQALKPNPGLYLPLQGGIMSGEIDMNKHRILRLPAPVDPQEPLRLADTPAAATFLALTDTPASYAAQALKFLRVKATVDGLEFATVAVAAGEGHITIPSISYNTIPQGTWVLGQNASHSLCHYIFNSSDTDGDSITFQTYLDQGTYTLLLFAVKHWNYGIIDIDIDAVEVASWDLYSAVLLWNQRFTQANITVSTAGLKTLTARVDGKNPSAVKYRITFTYIALWRTA